MRYLTYLICFILAAPILLILAGWVFPLSEAGADNWSHIASTVLGDYIRGSVVLVIGVGIGVAIIGTTLAWIVARFDFPLRGLLSWGAILPFAVPGYISALVYGNLLEFAGPLQTLIRDSFDLAKGDYWFPDIRSMGGAIFVLILSGYAYVFLLTRAAFERQPAHWFEMSAVFGKSRAVQFWRMALPAALPFMTVGVALAVMEASADLGVVDQFGVSTLATGIYRQFYQFDDPMVSARIMSFLLIFAALIFLIERNSRKEARFSSTENKSDQGRRKVSRGRGWLLTFIVSLPMILGFIVPVLWLMRMSAYSASPFHLAKVWAACADSLMLAVCGAGLVLLVALLINHQERQAKRPEPIVRIIVSIGYVIPGLAIAFGLLIVQKYFRVELGLSLIFTGSIAGLLLAYLIRFLSPAFSSINTGFLQIPPELDLMAKSMGKSRREVFMSVHLPLLKTPAFYAFTMVAIDIFKELPATLILRPFEIKTLAIAVFELADDGRPAEAAPYALTLVAVSVVAVYLLAKLQEKIDERAAT